MISSLKKKISVSYLKHNPVESQNKKNLMHNFSDTL